ncbi:unnamed protein product, partial [marine sediment metagenome]
PKRATRVHYVAQQFTVDVANLETDSLFVSVNPGERELDQRKI